ncbi:hypothetical protein PAPYR_369 [Paratrimastix pyriformis]|uniref:MYND-type domain-containing protein n=1 Tax=Paratrimastix pyriformis TaxID=342808 RepID=A0ABQ8UVK3_9EUKA|nr:hypothetical protein PAPYR_369 [Paratrimastix pyriformis]
MDVLITEKLGEIQYDRFCLKCGRPAELRCGKCRGYYCSKEHQAADWNDGHRFMCVRKSLLVETRKGENAPRVALASRPYAQGDIVCMETSPLLVMPDAVTHPFMMAAHQAAMATLPSPQPDEPDFPAQTLARLLRPVVVFLHKTTPAAVRRFLLDLHCAPVEEMFPRMRTYLEAALTHMLAMTWEGYTGLVDGATEAAPLPTRDQMMHVVQAWHSYAMEGRDTSTMFPIAARFPHSCRPTCFRSVLPDGTLFIKALRAMVPGEPLTISRINTKFLFEPTVRRQAVLRDAALHQCACPACVPVSSSLTASPDHVPTAAVPAPGAVSFFCRRCPRPDPNALPAPEAEPAPEEEQEAAPAPAADERAKKTEDALASLVAQLPGLKINRPAPVPAAPKPKPKEPLVRLWVEGPDRALVACPCELCGWAPTRAEADQMVAAEARVEVALEALDTADAGTRTPGDLLQLLPLCHEAGLGPEHWLMARVYDMLHAYYKLAGQFGRAAWCLKKRVDTLERLSPLPCPEKAWAYEFLADTMVGAIRADLYPATPEYPAAVKAFKEQLRQHPVPAQGHVEDVPELPVSFADPGFAYSTALAQLHILYADTSRYLEECQQKYELYLSNERALKTVAPKQSQDEEAPARRHRRRH